LLQDDRSKLEDAAEQSRVAAAALGVILPPEALEVPEEADLEIEPEAAPAVELFCRVLTQWRTSPNGYLGLDYGVLLSLMDLDGVKRKKRAALLADIGIMEGTWLHEFRVAKQGSNEDS
jgi:hypothetical protein